MTTEIDPVVVLNRMIGKLLSSFPVYLETTRPWSDRDPKNVCGRLCVVASDQRAMAGRLIDKIHRFGAQADVDGFPREFTAFNDLGIAKVLNIAIERQRTMIEYFSNDADLLTDYPGLAPLAKEVVGNARGHLAAMEELRAEL